MNVKIAVFLSILKWVTVTAVRINFTSCSQTEWFCVEDVPNDIVYSCDTDVDDFIIHLKDYYTDKIRSVTVQNCKHIKVVLDCPILQKPSQLRGFTLKNSEKLEFVTLTSSSITQIPPEFVINNVKEIVSLPNKLFKNPSASTEFKCTGTRTLKTVKILNSNINIIETKAIHNVTGAKSIEFNNVTISNIQTNAVDAIFGYDDTVFTILNSRVDNIDFNGITVQSSAAVLARNHFRNIGLNTVNITARDLHITDNHFDKISSNGLILKSASTYIVNNEVDYLKRNAFSNIKCRHDGSIRKQLILSRNTFKNLEPYSFTLDYNSCKSTGAYLVINSNKIDCTCRNVAFLAYTANNEISRMFLDVTSNNTCIAPCVLPVDVTKLLVNNDMCELSLDPQVMCLLYNDKKVTEVTTDDDVTEPAPTFYLIRQANSKNGDASAAMTAIDTDILKGHKLNTTNKTIVNIMFDSSKDFVEALRSTNTNSKKADSTKVTASHEYVNNCTGKSCRNNAYDKQKALDFYKYIYAQLRTPKVKDIENKIT